MSLYTERPESGNPDRSAYDRRYYLANRAKKIEAAKASYRRRREQEKARAVADRAARSRPRLYVTR